MHISWPKKNTFLIQGACIVVLIVAFFCIMHKTVTIRADGRLIRASVFGVRTVEDVLTGNHIGIGQKDRISPSLTAHVSNHMNIVVTRAFKVKVIADGTERVILTPPVTPSRAIRLAGFRIGKRDIIQSPSVFTVSPDQTVELIRVSEKAIVQQVEMPYQVETVDEPTLERGLTKTVQEGQNGIARNTLKITYHNGKEINRQIIKTETLQYPQNRVIAMGSITSVSRGGQRFNFREARLMQATAYTYTGFKTATGRTPAVGMVAVDPSVIPLGKSLYVEGYGYAFAADTGGAVIGNRIDLFMEDGSQCLNWGRRTVKVYVLN